MSKTKIFYLSVFAFSAVFALAAFYYLNETVFAEPSLNSSKNPCWFKGYDDPSITYEEIKARQDRQLYGYSQDVSIEKAVKKFNEEMRCYPQFSEFPDLTEDEVIASIIDFDSHNDELNYSEEKRKERKRIITEKILLKGSVLKFNFGSCVDVGNYMQNDLCARGLRITLTTNLDKLPDAKMTPPAENVFIIRKTFVKYQPRD